MVRSLSGHALGAQVARASRVERLSGAGGAPVSLEGRLDLLKLIYTASALLRQGEVSSAGQLLDEVCALVPGTSRRWAAGWGLRGIGWRDVRACAARPVPVSADATIMDRPAGCELPREAPARSISIYALGGFELIIDGVRFSSGVKPQRKPLELLKMLLLSGGEPLGAVELADKLWPDSDGDTGRNSLQVAVHRLRRLLGCETALVMQDRKLRLDPKRCSVDLWLFEREARQLAHVPVARMEFALRAAHVLQLYRGHLFAHESEQPWMLAPRERLRRVWLDLVRRLGQHYEMRGEWAQARELYERTVDLDPLAEETYRRLMLCQQKTGERAEAVHTYLRCCEQLDVGLGVKPSAETERVYQTLRSTA